MPSWNDIQKMNKEQLAAENEKLVKKLVLTQFVIPIAITAVIHFGVKYLVKKLEVPNKD